MTEDCCGCGHWKAHHDSSCRMCDCPGFEGKPVTKEEILERICPDMFALNTLDVEQLAELLAEIINKE